MLKKLRAFADLGRTQGITTTASVVIVGALTSTATVEWFHIVYFTAIAVFAHMALNTYIALGDIDLDAQTYIPLKNPITVGIITKNEAKKFFYAGTLACIILTLSLFFIYDNISILIATVLCFIPSYGSLIWYGWKGKKYALSYDFSFCISYAFFVLFGVFAVNGMPTIYTWIFIGIVIFAASAFAQWENGLKDVDADRNAGVKSLAVLTSVKNNEKLHLTHPYFIYGCLLKTGFLVCCFIAYLNFSGNFSVYYLLFVLLFGVPTQVFILYRFLVKYKPIEHRKTILLDVTFSGILGYSIIIGYNGVLPFLLLIAYLIVGYLVGSAFQYNAEFKFSRFSRA